MDEVTQIQSCLALPLSLLAKDEPSPCLLEAPVNTFRPHTNLFP